MTVVHTCGGADFVITELASTCPQCGKTFKDTGTHIIVTLPETNQNKADNQARKAFNAFLRDSRPMAARNGQTSV